MLIMLGDKDKYVLHYRNLKSYLMGKRELITLLNLSSWCLVMVELLFLAVPQGSLQFVIVVFPDHTHLLFLQLGLQIKTIHTVLEFDQEAWL